jgi:hypothetical protein
MNMFFNKKKKPLGYTIGDLEGYGEVKFVSDLPKSEKILVKTTKPKNKIHKPYTNPSMGYISDYWSSKRHNFNHELYMKVLRAKKELL